MLEIIGCILLILINISFICMTIDELITNYELRKNRKKVIDKAIKYIKEKQKIQYKFALSHIECDDLLEILEDKEVSE